MFFDKDISEVSAFFNNSLSEVGMFFSKQEEVTGIELVQRQNQLVIYNLMDHESVIAANLYKASSPLHNVTLIDIRDPLLPAESYIWLGVGNRDSLMAYYDKNLRPGAAAEIMRNSVFLERPCLMSKLSAIAVERNGGDIEKTPLLAKWGISSSIFHTNCDEIERIVRYYKVLEICHAAHTIGGDASDRIACMAVEASDAEVKSFKEKQYRINQSLANKFCHIAYPVKGGGKIPFIQMTTLDSVAYSIIRRCASIGKNFLHQSMGVYGQIVYSNKAFDSTVFDIGKQSALFIQGE